MSRGPLFAVVAISGACVLALEILGTRVLGPFYGVSLFLWSALIAVTLAALSAGYLLGGAWADRGPRAGRLAWILAAAGAWVLLVPLLRAPLLASSDGLGLRGAVLVAAVGLFFPPLTLLGMVGPYAIRLSAGRLEEVGRVAGSLFAVSTLASVAAALLTGFWLIPAVGVTRLTLAVGCLLLFAAVVAWLGAGARRPGPAVPLVALVLAGAGGWALAHADAPPAAGTRFLAQSPYAQIEVRDLNGVRFLLIDGGVHTAVRTDWWVSEQEYVIVSELAQEMFARPGRMLLVGLGGGAAARSFWHVGWKVETVEIDPVVVEVARRYFRITPQVTDIHLMDGRRFLRTTDERFDLLFLDAFGSSSIPFHLVTREAFALARSRLAPGGILMLNLEAKGWHDPIVNAVGATLGREFAHVLALPIAEPPNRLGNVIVLASDRALDLDEGRLGDPLGSLSDPYEHWRVLQRNHAWDNRFTPRGGQVLTDDLNPVDLWAESTHLAARRDVRRFFGRAGSVLR